MCPSYHLSFKNWVFGRKEYYVLPSLPIKPREKKNQDPFFLTNVFVHLAFFTEDLGRHSRPLNWAGETAVGTLKAGVFSK